MDLTVIGFNLSLFCIDVLKSLKTQRGISVQTDSEYTVCRQSNVLLMTMVYYYYYYYYSCFCCCCFFLGFFFLVDAYYFSHRLLFFFFHRAFSTFLTETIKCDNIYTTFGNTH